MPMAAAVATVSRAAAAAAAAHGRARSTLFLALIVLETSFLRCGRREMLFVTSTCINVWAW